MYISTLKPALSLSSHKIEFSSSVTTTDISLFIYILLHIPYSLFNPISEREKESVVVAVKVMFFLIAASEYIMFTYITLPMYVLYYAYHYHSKFL